MSVLRRLLKLAPIAALLCTSLSHAAEDLADKAVIYLYNESYSWAGDSITEKLFTHGEEGIFSYVRPWGSSTEGVRINYDDGYDWSFRFVAPTYNKADNTNVGQVLREGFYDQAQRPYSASPTRPGMEISTTGMYSGMDYAWFKVLEIEYDSVTGDLERFAVDFRQYGAKSGDHIPTLYGSLRFNSDIAINPVPEPETYAMLLAGLGVLGFGVRRRKQGKLAEQVS